MDVHLNLTDDVLARLRDAAAQDGQALDAFVESLVVSRLADFAAPISSQPADDFNQWQTDLDAFIAAHPPRLTPADTDRETIYSDRSQ